MDTFRFYLEGQELPDDMKILDSMGDTQELAEDLLLSWLRDVRDIENVTVIRTERL